MIYQTTLTYRHTHRQTLVPLLAPLPLVAPHPLLVPPTHIPLQRVDSSKNCLFGETLTVERRLVNVCCYSGGDYTRVTSVTPCVCIPDDYEWLVDTTFLHGGHTPFGRWSHSLWKVVMPPLVGGHAPFGRWSRPLWKVVTPPLGGGHTPQGITGSLQDVTH